MSRKEDLAILCDAVYDDRMDEARVIADRINATYGEIRIGEQPWPEYRHGWTGKLVSIEETPNTDVTAADVLFVIAYGDTGSDAWDGEIACVLLLKDRRFMVWESSWGPTGSGFSCDAYGGNADIAFAPTLHAAVQYLSERARELIASLV